jgi:hypothetical protein
MNDIVIERHGLAVLVRRGASIVGVFDNLRAAFAFIAQGAGR